jgi:hypothetical protein
VAGFHFVLRKYVFSDKIMQGGNVPGNVCVKKISDCIVHHWKWLQIKFGPVIGDLTFLEKVIVIAFNGPINGHFLRIYPA